MTTSATRAIYQPAAARVIEGDLLHQHGVVAELKTAALCDRNGRGVLSARGNDRQAFLHAMLSNVVNDVPAGRGCRAELLDDRGHVVADFRVIVLADEVRLEAETLAIAAKAKAALEKFVIMDDVTFEDLSAVTAVLTVSGPKAGEILSCTHTDAWSSVQTNIAGHPAIVIASKWTGRGDYDVMTPAAARSAVKAVLTSAGATEISLATFDALRIEAGVATQAGELDDVLALEAKLAPEAVSFTKGCYLGQEVMARIDARGHVNRTLVGLTLEGDSPAARGATLKAADKDVGRITSSVISPTLQKPIALAYVRREQSAPGASLTVDGRVATVVALPFV